MHKYFILTYFWYNTSQTKKFRYDYIYFSKIIELFPKLNYNVLNFINLKILKKLNDFIYNLTKKFNLLK